jgi:hypothetical protein
MVLDFACLEEMRLLGLKLPGKITRYGKPRLAICFNALQSRVAIRHLVDETSESSALSFSVPIPFTPTYITSNLYHFTELNCKQNG